jgi:hypothetical protein
VWLTTVRHDASFLDLGSSFIDPPERQADAEDGELLPHGGDQAAPQGLGDVTQALTTQFQGIMHSEETDIN